MDAPLNETPGWTGPRTRTAAALLVALVTVGASATLFGRGNAVERPEAGRTSAGGGVVPGFQLDSTGPTGGEIWRGAIPGAARESLVYLPPGYAPGQRYPVAYLLAGMPGSPWSYVHALHLASAADTLITQGGAQPFVAVMPVAGPSGHYAGEWAGPWENYVVSNVVPWVDAHLSTIATPGGRTIAGLSAGGFGAIDIALRHVRLFGRVESWGGYFSPVADGPLAHASRALLAAHDPKALARRNAPLLRTLGTRFFVSTGPGHGHVTVADTVRFDELLATLHLPHRLELLPSRKNMWERQLVDGLRWAFVTH